MATSIASQLQAIRTSTHREAEQTKRPFTRPSVIFNPKEAADIDVETILSISLLGKPIRSCFSPFDIGFLDIVHSFLQLALIKILFLGLEALIEIDARFQSYKGTLFSQKSRELDRELMGAEENAKMDVSISSYLRLLAGYLHLPAALKTLEYLIRRYKYVHSWVLDLELVKLCCH